MTRPPPIRLTIAIVLAGLGAVFGGAGSARADDDKPELMHMRFVEVGDQLTITTDQPPGTGKPADVDKAIGIGKLFDVPAFDSLPSGMQKVVVVIMRITPRDSDKPIAEQVLLRTAQYDLWNENYTIHFEGPTGTRTFTVKTQSDALIRLTTIETMPIAKLSAIPYNQEFVLKVIAQLDPPTDEMRAEIPRWLSKGTGATGLDRGGTFFGSFVSIFYHPKVSEAERILRIMSQPFYRPAP